MIGQDEQPLADLQHRGGQLAERVLLLADDPLALLDEADRDGVGDAVGGRLVGVQHPVEQVEVVAVLLEQRAGQHVAQQQDDADDLVGLDAARDDPLGQVAGVVLQRLDAAGLEHLDVVVVDRGGLGEHLLGRHRREQVRVGDPLGPLLPQLGSGSLAGGRPARAAARRPRCGRARRWPRSGRPWCRSCPRLSRRCSLVVLFVSRQPLRHGHRGALAGAESRSNSSISRRAPGSPRPSPSVGAVAVLHRLLGVLRSRADVARHDADAAASVPPRSAR